MGNKLCFSCKTTKTKDEFDIARGRPDGVCVYCKLCTSRKSAARYARVQIAHKCKICGVDFTGGKNKTICSVECRNITRRKGIDGYKPCEWCALPFPFRYSAKTRGQNYHGVKIGSVRQRFCSITCARKWKGEQNKKWRPTPEMRQATRIRMQLLFKGKKLSLARRKKMSEVNTGSKSHFWKGGIAPQNKVIRHSLEYRLWREAVYKRDDYTCQACGQRGGKLNADHELPFALYPDLRFEILNGRTLCEVCHKKTPTYGGRMNKTDARQIY